MARENEQALRKDFLTQRAMRFFNRYGEDVDSIRQLLEIRLNQLALAYTLENRLPRQAVQVGSRVKTLDSLLRKLERMGWPEFYYPFEVAQDLVAARVVCWFLDDCYGMLDYIQASKQIDVRPDSLEDYIKNPKETGYRSIHLLCDIVYDRVKKVGAKRRVESDKVVCEIQIRTKLQDAWAEFTYEVHYRSPGPLERNYETLVAESASRLASEDRSAVALRKIIQDAGEGKEHEGVTDD